jgi:hypothetical protein
MHTDTSHMTLQQLSDWRNAHIQCFGPAGAVHEEPAAAAARHVVADAQGGLRQAD